MSWFKKLADHARAENNKILESARREEQYRDARNAAKQKYQEYLESVECCANCVFYEPRGYVDLNFGCYDLCIHNDIIFDDDFDPQIMTCIDFFKKQ